MSFIIDPYRLGGAIPPLDGLSTGLTGAYSPSRKLLTSWGGALYINASGAVQQINDQSGTSNTFAQATAGLRPLASTAGPKNRLSMDFDGTDDYLTTASLTSTFFTTTTGWMCATFIADGINSNNGTIYTNDAIFDSFGWSGLYLTSVPRVYAQNWDGNSDAIFVGISLSTVTVVEWMHTGGNISVRVGGSGAYSSVASGTTAGASTCSIGRCGSSPKNYLDGKIFELVTYNVVPNSTDRDLIASRLLQWVN